VEAVQFDQPNRAVAAFDVAQDTAGADGGQLLIITDQPDAAAAANNELDGGVKGERVRHPGFVYQHQRQPANAVDPVGQFGVFVLEGPGEFGECVGGRPSVFAKLCGRGGGRGQRKYSPAALQPRLGEGA